MASIDNRVVSITFDNAAFEKNVQQTLSTLATLKASLDFKGSGASLEEVSAAAGRFSLAGIGDAVDSIASKFSAMGAIAFSIINNITTRAFDAGLQLAKAFTIQPVTDGFAEFELKMGSIQTIMAGSGESLETVNRKLEELNRYSDQTIYSFADMTQNIGKFTNAGLDLDTSVASIQGIANVAAISGANAEEASRAMYNFAQSLSAGSVKLMDWKSIENANMATAEFKQQLIDSAVAAGTLNMSADGLYTTLEGTPVSSTKGFNESLTDQWLTTEALNATLGRYSDTTTDIGKRATAAASDIKTFSQMMDTLKESAGSGWAQTFEIFIGDFEESKALFTEIGESLSTVIGNSADARNKVLSDWDSQGGRILLIDSIREGIKNIGEAIQPVKDAFREIFPRKTGDDLMRMTETFARFVGLLKPGEKTIKSLKSIFLGLFAAIDIVMEVVKGVFSVFKTLFGLFAGGSSGAILQFFAKIGDGIVKLREELVTGGGIADYFEKINEAITKFIGTVNLSPVISGFKTFREIAGNALTFVTEKFQSFFGAVDFSPLESAINSVKTAFQTLFTGKDGESGVVPAAAGESVNRFAGVLEYLGDALKAVGEFIKTVFKGVGKVGSVLGTIAKGVGSAVATIWEAMADVFSGSGPPSVDTILKVLAGGALTAIAAAFVKFAKDGFKLDFGQFDLLDSLGDSLDAVTGSLKAMQKDILAGALLKIAIAIGVLTLSLIALSFVNGTSLAKSMTAVSAGIGLLVAAMAGLDKVASGEGSAAKIALLAISMTAIAGAMLLLAMAASLMATTDPVALSIGLLGMLAALTMIADVMEKLTKNTDGMVKAAFSIGILSASLLLLAVAVRAWMALDMLEMSIAIFAISAALTVISETMGNMPADGMVKAAISIGILAGSLVLMAFAIKKMSDIGLVDTAVGLSVVAVSLALMADVLKKVSKNKDVEKAGLAILSISFGMILMARAIEKIGSLDLWSIIKGVGAIAVMMLVLGKAMNASKQSMGGSASLLLAAAAILVFGMAIEKVAAIPFWDLVKGMGAVLIAVGLMAGVSALLTPIIPLMAGLGAALAMIGVAALAFGAGVFYLASGVQILAKVGPEGVDVFIKALTKLLKVLPSIAIAMGEAAFMFVTSFLGGFDELIPLVVDLLGKLLDAIEVLYPRLRQMGIDMIIGMLQAIRTIFPEIVATGWAIIMALFNGIKDNIGELASTAIGIVTNFINAMADGIPDYVRAMVNLFKTVMKTMAYELGLLMVTLGPELGIAFINGILTGIEQTVQIIKDFFGDWAGKILDFIKGLFGIKSPSLEFASIGIDLILGLLQGIVDTIGQVASFFGNLLTDILGWIGETIGTLVSKGTDLIVGLFKGVTDKFVEVGLWFLLLPFKIIGKIGNVLETLLQTGKNLILGLLNGAKEVFETMLTWVGGLARRILTGLGMGVTYLLQTGKDFLQGLWDGLKAKGKEVLDWAGDFAGDVLEKFTQPWKLFSPSRAMREMGQYLMIGLNLGMEDDKHRVFASAESVASGVMEGLNVDEKDMTNPIRNAMSNLVNDLQSMEDFGQPVITPVLDLSEVQKDAKSLNRVLATSANLNSAIGISNATDAARAVALSEAIGPTQITYEQNINAPTALSTNDIYRQTRSLIALTKAEASIP